MKKFIREKLLQFVEFIVKKYNIDDEEILTRLKTARGRLKTMTKYEVELTQEELYVIEVEAENEDQAVEKAIELFDKNKKIYHYDSDTKINVVR